MSQATTPLRRALRLASGCLLFLLALFLATSCIAIGLAVGRALY